MIERTALWFAQKKTLGIFISVFVVIGVWLLERHADPLVYQWVVRVGAAVLLVLFTFFISYVRLQHRGRPIESAYPQEPLEIVKILRSLQPLEPHCLWSGRAGQLWGIHVRGHQRELPFAQNRKEVWVMHVDGHEVQLDARSRTHTLKAGQWMKLPQGVGSGGIQSDGAFFLWSTQP